MTRSGANRAVGSASWSGSWVTMQWSSTVAMMIALSRLAFSWRQTSTSAGVISECGEDHSSSSGFSFFFVMTSGSLVPGSAPAVFAGLESTAAQTLQTLGVGMGYSTLGAFVERRTNIPLEIWLTYDTAIAGSGGAPDVGVARLTGRIWVPAWGGR